MKNEKVLYAIVIVALILFAALVAFTIGNRGNTGGITPPQTSTLTITASGVVSNKSSQASLYVIVNGTGPTNNAAVQNVSATLQQFNITIYGYVNGNLSMISTNYFNVYKLYNKTGYEALESLYVIIPNIDNVSSAIGALSSIPNVYVTGATPMLSSAQVSAMRVAALSLALSNATAQAQALIGKNNTIYATNISINNYYVYPYVYSLGTSSVVAAPSQINRTIPTEFYGGTNKVTESITVTFIYGRKR
jgi:uncharacterized protein YggE